MNSQNYTFNFDFLPFVYCLDHKLTVEYCISEWDTVMWKLNLLCAKASRLRYEFSWHSFKIIPYNYHPTWNVKSFLDMGWVDD